MTSSTSSTTPLDTPGSGTPSPDPVAAWLVAHPSIEPAELRLKIELIRLNRKLPLEQAQAVAMNELEHSNVDVERRRTDTNFEAISLPESTSKITLKESPRLSVKPKVNSEASKRNNCGVDSNLQPPLPFVLPNISLAKFRATPALFLLEAAQASYFSPRVIAWALQNGQSLGQIEAYLNSFDSQTISSKINERIYCDELGESVPILFFAVENGSLDMIRSLVKAGANLEARSVTWCIPVLTYTVLLYDIDKKDTTQIFKYLLALGADPLQIPKDMWISYIDDPKCQIISTTSRRAWCEAEIRNNVVFNLNLSQRYFLHKAYALGSPNAPTRRMKESAAHFSVSTMLEAPFHLIGQEIANTMVAKQILTHLILKSEKPIALIFTGRSGHGKTELAKNMEHLLECPAVHVDCTEMRHETDIMGPKAPYVGHAKGSPLNNHLAETEGRRNIVFLDEFEKTNHDVRQALLLPLDDGTYIDRRNGKKLDTKKTIWIFATNHSEEVIDEFTEKHRAPGEDFVKKAPHEVLKKDLRDSFKVTMGAPLIGRITAIIPFFPFTPHEQAVIAHSFLLKETTKSRTPISLPEAKLLGDLHISTSHQDAKLCKLLASRHYDPDLGARSLAQAVNDGIMVPLIDVFLESQGLLERGPRADVALEKYSVQIEHNENSHTSDIVVRRDGETPLKSIMNKKTEPLFIRHESWKEIEQETFTMTDDIKKASGSDSLKQTSETVCVQPNCPELLCPFKHHEPRKTSFSFTGTSGSRPVEVSGCMICSGSHGLLLCPKAKVCMACGAEDHLAAICSKPTHCLECGAYGHTKVLCPNKKPLFKFT